MLKHIPNILTLGRLVLTVVFLAMVLYVPYVSQEKVKLFWDVAFVIFVIAGVTDLVDGSIARSLNVTSKFGRIMDPLADKVLVIGAFVCFAVIGEPRLFNLSVPVLAVIHWTVVGILIARDLYVTVIRHIAESHGIDFGAVLSGKVKVFLHCFAVGTVVIRAAHVQGEAWGYWFTVVTLLIMVVVTIVSGLTYHTRWRKLLMNGGRSKIMQQNSPRKNYLLFMWTGNRKSFPWLFFSFLVTASFLPYLGAMFDRSIYLPDDALGILEHYGNMAFTIILPLVFVFCMRGVRCLNQFISNIDGNIIEAKSAKKANLKEFLQANWTTEPYVPLKYVFISVGFVLATVNAINATTPERVWHHDVYDSVSHIGGYLTQRIFFYTWWAYVLPVLVYRLFVIVTTLDRFFSLLIDTDSLDLQPMHPDNAGGLGMLGKMALNFNIAMLLTMAISVTLYYTHGYNTPLIRGIVVQFLLLPVVFFLPLLRAHKAMKLKRESLLLRISKHYRRVSDVLVQKMADGDMNSGDRYDRVKDEYEEESQLRALYQSLETIPTWPFDTRTIIWFASTILLPVAIWLIDEIKILF